MYLYSKKRERRLSMYNYEFATVTVRILRMHRCNFRRKLSKFRIVHPEKSEIISARYKYVAAVLRGIT